MTRTLLEWTDSTGAVGALELDVVKTRGFELAAEVTEFPVERGAAITDHVRPLNGTVALEGLVTNTPLVVPATQMDGIAQTLGSVVLPGGDGKARATLYRWSSTFDRVRVCDTVLAGLVRAGAVVKLTTSLRVLEDLAITRYKVDQDGTTGQGLPIVLEFKALRFATTARAAVPAVRRLRVPETRGVQTPDNRSLLARTLDRGAPANAARQRALAAQRQSYGGGA